MAAAATAAATSTRTSTAQTFQDHKNSNDDIQHEVSRHEIQAATSKAVELRALHAALMQANSPANLSRFPNPSESPVSRHVPHCFAQDYPVFTPSYEDEPVPGYQKFRFEGQNFAESYDVYAQEGHESGLSNYRKTIASSRKRIPSHLVNLEQQHACPAEDQGSVAGSNANHITLRRASPGTDFSKSRRNSLGDFRSLSSCNKCNPATHKNRGLNFSQLFPWLKKKNKSGNSPTGTESEEVSHVFKDLGMVSIEPMKKELLEAIQSREKASLEVAGMKSSMGELKQKLEYLETYCEEMKKALRQTLQLKNFQATEKLGNLPKLGKSIHANVENSMPVSKEVMTEGFLQIVSETRLSVKQFCQTLVGQIEEKDNTLKDNLNFLLLPYKLSLSSKFSKAVLYHLESIINQSLYQDFENCVFKKNGSPKFLDPQKDRQSQFSSFVALRNLSWNDVLRKGTKYHSEEFSKFCDQKMSSIIATLNWTRPWPEQLLQEFFVSAKCIWLLHLLAFSFNPPLGILRVEENRTYDPHFMDDIFMDRQKSQGERRVKIMVMPGFYVHDKVLKCKVLCRYKCVSK